MNARAWLVALLLLAGLFVSGYVRADDHPDQGSAYAHCLEQSASARAARPDLITDVRCAHWTSAGTPYYQCEARTYSWFSCRQVVGSGEYFHYYGAGQSCSKRPSQVTQFLPLSGSTQCWNGCVVTYRQNGDDTTSTRSPTGATCGPEFKDNCGAGFFWNSHMGVCQPIEPDCPEGQKKEEGVCKPEEKCPEGYVAVTGYTPGAIQQGALYCKRAVEECPAGTIKSPEGKCLPGEGQCAAGEARRENGTCGKDANGDGKADDDDDDTSNDPKKSFAGGDSCDVPPSCNGDAIMCGQARIQWRIDCNTRRNVNISGGSCSNVPICTGKDCKAMEYSQLLMQWRTACALEKQQSPGGGQQGQPDWTKVTGDGTSGAGEDPDKPHRTIALGLSRLDGTGFFGGSGACPQFGSVDLGYFGSVNLDQWPWICQFFSAVRIVLIAMGAFIAFGIIAGRVF